MRTIDLLTIYFGMGEYGFEFCYYHSGYRPGGSLLGLTYDHQGKRIWVSLFYKTFKIQVDKIEAE